MLARSDVVAAYRIILGRDPETEGIITHHISTSDSLETLRDVLLTSDEFLKRLQADERIRRALKPAVETMQRHIF